jgi:DNA-binding MarR family transcriptional regulator
LLLFFLIISRLSARKRAASIFLWAVSVYLVHPPGAQYSERTQTPEKKRKFIMRSLYINIHYLLQDFYLLRRRVRQSNQSGYLSTSESQILFEVYMNPGIHAGTLASLFSLDKSTISKTIRKLAKNKYLSSSVDRNDSRLKNLTILAKGKEYVTGVQTSSNRIIETLFSHFTFEEQLELARFIHALGEAHSVPLSSRLPDDHPITTALVRLGRASGMTGSSFLSSSFSGTQYYILQLLSRDSTETISSLGVKLLKDKSTISRIMKKFLTDKFIETVSGKDQQASHFRLLEAGRNTLNEIDLLAEAFIAKGLASQSSKEKKRFYDLLVKLIKEQPHGDFAPSTQSNTTIRKLQTLRERQIARGLLMQQFVKEGNHFSTPDLLFTPNCTAYGLFCKEDLIAACVLNNKGKSATLDLIASQPQLAGEDLQNFIEQVLCKD